MFHNNYEDKKIRKEDIYQDKHSLNEIKKSELLEEKLVD